MFFCCCCCYSVSEIFVPIFHFINFNVATSLQYSRYASTCLLYLLYFEWIVFVFIVNHEIKTIYIYISNGKTSVYKIADNCMVEIKSKLWNLIRFFFLSFSHSLNSWKLFQRLIMWHSKNKNKNRQWNEQNQDKWEWTLKRARVVYVCYALNGIV